MNHRSSEPRSSGISDPRTRRTWSPWTLALMLMRSDVLTVLGTIDRRDWNSGSVIPWSLDPGEHEDEGNR